MIEERGKDSGILFPSFFSLALLLFFSGVKVSSGQKRSMYEY